MSTLNEVIKWNLALIALGLVLLISKNSFAQLQCYTDMIEQTLLNENQALELCCERSDLAPLRCFNFAQERYLLTDGELIQLCRCARSIEPADCYGRAQTRTNLGDAEIINMCAAAPDRITPSRPYLQPGADRPAELEPQEEVTPQGTSP